MKIVWFEHAANGMPVGVNPNRVEYILSADGFTRIYFSNNHWLAVKEPYGVVASKLTE